MKIAVIATTKNEEDIIESFVRHNSEFCDAMFFIDNSTDQTRDILQKLKTEGYLLEIIEENNSIYYQGSVISAALHHLAADRFFDWFLLLDADEFVAARHRNELEENLEQIPSGHLGALHWQTFVPYVLDAHTLVDPILQGYKPRSFEHPVFSKLCVSADLAGSIQMGPGNHSAQFQNGTGVPAVLIDIRLAHFPVRSEFQIMRKNLIATHNLAMKPKRLEGEGSHVFPIFNAIRDGNYYLSFMKLQKIALGYALFGSSEMPQPVEQWQPWTERLQPLRYTPPPSMKQVVAALDREVGRLTAIIVDQNCSLKQDLR